MHWKTFWLPYYCAGWKLIETVIPLPELWPTRRSTFGKLAMNIQTLGPLTLIFQLYKHIHKKHHEWQASVAYTSIYAHPFEHLVSNLVGPFLGPLILKAHITTGETRSIILSLFHKSRVFCTLIRDRLLAAWLWFFLAISVTINSHSGYHLPFMPSPEAHDFHHLKFNQCFGVLGFLDWLHGTDKVFRSNEVTTLLTIISLSMPRLNDVAFSLQAFNRHITSFSLTPVREIFPDGTAKKTK